MSEQEQVVVKYNKYSAWTVIKVMIFCYIVTFIMTGGSFAVVNTDIALAKASRFIESAYETLCSYCRR